MSTNMFEIAARNKFRFPFKGMISTEDLWDLSVENLDNVFKTLNSCLLYTSRGGADWDKVYKMIEEIFSNCDVELWRLERERRD